MLWDHNITVKWLLSVGFSVSFCATFTMMTLTVVKIFDGIRYNDFAQMCVITTATHWLIGVWASPMLFEVLVLLLTSWNAFDRPRMASLRLASALHRDGMTFFMALTTLRALNLALAITNKPSVMVIAVFFVWSMTTLVLNRALLHVRRVEVIEAFTTEWPASETFDLSSLDEWDLEEIQEFEVPWGNAEGLLDGKSPIIIELDNFIPWQKRDEPAKVCESQWF